MPPGSYARGWRWSAARCRSAASCTGTPAQEDARRRSRERARLVVERGQHTSRIKGLLMTQGIRDFEPTRRDWQARVEGPRTPDGQPLAPCLRTELLRECRRLRQVMEMVAEVEAEQKAVAAEA